ncbi:hypothetical protein K443DRAFT_130485 [Laccaria amethystina LaAM-08-1]|uniref:Uncharacterized protein n=1 Tax=Laccaria amethystina LaAM-08-1 TaxID=1095629 RepID=A0A0C9XJW4_9AGAR|nr:hypothetical protein K443DRAFT_130485 [Laccaria amethystina LaAM-08-1]
MQFRIACMYSYCRKIIILMVIAFTIEVISMTAINLAYLDVVVEISNSQFLCMGKHFPNLYPVYFWIVMFSFELIILLLGLQAGLIYFKESRTFPSNSLRRPLRSILICDSIVFPLIAFAIGGINIFAWTRLPYYYVTITVTLAQLSSRILGCRLLLNLREAYYLPFETECGHSYSQNLQFA